MPCFKCTNGKWKFGRTGACKHATKSACDAANKPKKKRTTPKRRKVYGRHQMTRAITNRMRKDDDCADC